jgi:hypothetical protein
VVNERGESVVTLYVCKPGAGINSTSNVKDDRVLPKSHFSAPTRPTMRTSTAAPLSRPTGSRSSSSSNAVAGPSRQLSKPNTPAPAHGNLGEQVRREAREGGITLTEEQLNDRIQTIVEQVMKDRAKEEVKPVPMVVDTEPVVDATNDVSARPSPATAVDLNSLTEEEIRSRAKVLTNLARQHHDK